MREHAHYRNKESFRQLQKSNVNLELQVKQQ